jgi:hypothetical protein
MAFAHSLSFLHQFLVNIQAAKVHDPYHPLVAVDVDVIEPDFSPEDRRLEYRFYFFTVRTTAREGSANASREANTASRIIVRRYLPKPDYSGYRT